MATEKPDVYNQTADLEDGSRNSERAYATTTKDDDHPRMLGGKREEIGQTSASADGHSGTRRKGLVVSMAWMALNTLATIGVVS